MTAFASTSTFATSTSSGPAVFFASLVESMQASDSVKPGISVLLYESATVDDVVSFLTDVLLAMCRQSKVEKEVRIDKVRCSDITMKTIRVDRNSDLDWSKDWSDWLDSGGGGELADAEWLVTEGDPSGVVFAGQGITDKKDDGGNVTNHQSIAYTMVSFTDSAQDGDVFTSRITTSHAPPRKQDSSYRIIFIEN